MTANNDVRSDETSDALTTFGIPDASKISAVTRKDYNDALEKFDIAVCDAIAISQASANRMAAPNYGFGTQIFTCICSAAVAMIRAAPLSRWIRSDFPHWALNGIAAHARAIIEGHLLLAYIMEIPASADALSAKLDVMHLNDCTRRITLFTNLGTDDQIKKFETYADELKNRLRNNTYFCLLPKHIQKRCIDGGSPMIVSRTEMLDKVGWERNHFRAMYDLLSQHAHILPLSFYRLETNGRGTGLENPTDRYYLQMTLLACTDVLEKCTSEMLIAFPDTVVVRQGKKSRFSPGPRGNLPR